MMGAPGVTKAPSYQDQLHRVQGFKVSLRLHPQVATAFWIYLLIKRYGLQLHRCFLFSKGWPAGFEDLSIIVGLPIGWGISDQKLSADSTAYCLATSCGERDK